MSVLGPWVVATLVTAPRLVSVPPRRSSNFQWNLLPLAAPLSICSTRSQQALAQMRRRCLYPPRIASSALMQPEFYCVRYEIISECGAASSVSASSSCFGLAPVLEVHCGWMTTRCQHILRGDTAAADSRH